MRNPQQYSRRGQGGLDGIISKTTSIDEQQRREEAQEEYYRGLAAESPPLNYTFGEVVSLEKSDLMFVMMAIQTCLLLIIVLQRGG